MEDWATELCERLFLRSDAPLREEGENLLGHELRRSYLAILRTLAGRRSCTHAELREALPESTSLGPYLKTLTQDLRLVEKSFRCLPTSLQEERGTSFPTSSFRHGSRQFSPQSRLRGFYPLPK